MRIPPELERRARRVPVDLDPGSVPVAAGDTVILISSSADQAGMAWLAEVRGLDRGGRVAHVLPLPSGENEFVAGRLRALARGDPGALDPEHLEREGDLAPLWEREAVCGEMLLARTPADDAREFESGRGTTERRRRGSFYTQAAEIELTTRLALAQLLDERDPQHAAEALAFILGDPVPPATAALEHLESLLAEISLLDPACGAGAFLVGGIATLSSIALHTGAALGRTVEARTLRHELAGRATGVDSDAEALAHAGRRTRVLCGRPVTLVHADSLLTPLAPAMLILGNPPYVRQERIAAPGASEPSDSTYKQSLLDAARAAGHSISPRADLYVHFIHRGLDLLTPGGVLAYVVSASWLDLDFAGDLRRRLAGERLLRSVHESQTTRSFGDADVNTVLLIAGRDRDRGAGARFASWRRALSDAPAPLELAQALAAGEARPGTVASTGSRDDIRIRRAGWPELDPRAGWGGVWLRAPDVHARTMQGARMRPLEEVARVRFGNKSGANWFFYVDEKTRLEAALPETALVPILCSARECPGYSTSSARGRRSALVVDDEHALERGDAIARYLQRGLERGVDRIRSVSSRRSWWRLEARAPAALLLPRRIGERFVVFDNDAGLLEDNNLFGIDPLPGVDAELLGGLLNSSWTRLTIELTSRPLTGSQPLVDTNVYIVKQLPVPDLRDAPAAGLERLRLAWRQLRRRESLPLEAELADPARRALDLATLGLMGVPCDRVEAVREEVASELLAMVRRRLDKSRFAAPRGLRRGAAPG